MHLGLVEIHDYSTDVSLATDDIVANSESKAYDDAVGILATKTIL